MAGLLDFMQSPGGIGLLSAVAGGFAGARRGTPINNVGRGLVSGLTGYTAAQDQIRQDAENKLMQEYKALQMQQIRDSIAAAQAQKQWRAGLPTKIAESRDKVEQFTPDDPFNEGAAAFGQLYGGDQHGQQASGLMANVTPGNPQALQEYLMQPDSPYADKILEKQLFPKDPEYKEVGGTLVQIGANGVNPVFTAPERETTPSAIREYQFAVSQGYKGSFDEWKKSNAAAGATQITYGQPQILTGPDGNPVAVQFGNRPGAAPQMTPLTGLTPEAKPPTGEERGAAGYLGRMRAAERLIGGLSGAESTVYTSVAGAVPFVGDYVQRKAMTPQQQQYKQAADDWIRAKLRKESGAVIGDEEMAREYQTYFPQPGDSQEVIAQKAQARRQADEQMRIGAGNAAPKEYEAPFTQAEADYISQRRAAGVPDAQIILELQRGAAKQKQAAPRGFALPPNPKQYEGKVLRDTVSGKRFKSVGGKWQEVR